MLRGTSDASLVAKSIDGSERAFGRLIARYSAVVYSVVRGILGNRHDVEDTVQEVFIKVYHGLPSYRGNAKLSTWIYRIARNHALNVRARPDHPQYPLEDAHHIAAPGAGPDESYRQAEIRRGIEHLLAGLDERYRVALELRYMAEKSYAEIADIMDLPVGTVKTYIHRGKLSLKRMLHDVHENEPREEYGTL